MSNHDYTAFGLHLASPFPCPELSPGPSTPDVIIRYGDVPDALPAPRKRGVRYQAAPGQLLLSVDGVARFLVLDGKEIVIARAPECDDESLRLFLLGSALGALLQQRGLLPLHASAVQVDGACVAFLGRSGVGKSTLASALLQRRYRLVADDIGAIDLGSEGIPLVYPGYPQVKLWADAVRRLHLSREGLRRVRPQMDKHAWGLDESFCPEALPLRRLYVLHSANSPDLTVQPITGGAKLEALKNHTYREPFLDGLASRAPQFRIAAAITRHVAMYYLTRPQYPFMLEEMVTLLEQEWSA